VANGLPPVGAAYHFIPVPVATRLATVGVCDTPLKVASNIAKIRSNRIILLCIYTVKTNDLIL
jgi:hypothetical protein